jgi:opacity protein-like surface antigen
MKKLLIMTAAVVAFATSAFANDLVTRFPWLAKAQWDLTKSECYAAMRHDSFYWWGQGKCHVREIRYASGVAIRDTVSQDPDDATTPTEDRPAMKKGELIYGIGSYDEKSRTYCVIRAAGCYAANDVRLLGSALTGHFPDAGADPMLQGVGTSCELLLADRLAVIKANSQDLLKGCHD